MLSESQADGSEASSFGVNGTEKQSQNRELAQSIRGNRPPSYIWHFTRLPIPHLPV